MNRILQDYGFTIIPVRYGHDQSCRDDVKYTVQYVTIYSNCIESPNTALKQQTYILYKSIQMYRYCTVLYYCILYTVQKHNKKLDVLYRIVLYFRGFTKKGLHSTISSWKLHGSASTVLYPDQPPLGSFESG